MIEKYEKQGFTNTVYIDTEKKQIIKQKKYDSFNHKLDYKVLNVLDFHPKVIEDNPQQLISQYIEGSMPEVTDEFLREVGKMLITLHDSKIKLPANNLARRFKVYRKMVSDLGRKIPVLDKYYKKINLFLKNIDYSAPCHNDTIIANFVRQKDTNKLYLIDWEYATMGDVHFDLAYFIESQSLTDNQIKVLLEAYGDDFSPYLLQVHRILVDCLVTLWVNKQEIKPFDETPFTNRIEPLFKKLNEMEKD